MRKAIANVTGFLALGWSVFSASAPAQAADAIDPARLSTAKEIATAILPPGTYRKLMGSTFDTIMSQTMKQTEQLPVADLVQAAGLDAKTASAMGSANLAQIMAIVDPAYDERMQRTMKAMMGQMVDLLDQFEPTLRDGIADAYAQHYSAAQLGEIEQFFQTPTGKEFSGNLMLLNSDPAVMAKMQEVMPALVKQLPAMIKAAADATKDLPKPKTYKDLTPDDRAKLAKVLGVDPKQLANPKTKT